jgi:cell division protein FtsB
VATAVVVRRGRVRKGVTKFVIVAVLITAGLALMTVLGVIPVRAYVLQRQELDATRGRLAMLDARNAALENRAKVLRTDTEMQRLALDQFGMVRPGERLTVIPGLRSEGSVLDMTRADSVVGPIPSAKTVPHVSRFRAILDAFAFWR